MKNNKLKLVPYFISSEEDLDECINWVKRDAVIKNVNGEVIFQQDGVEFPDFWSDQAVKIVTDKYFRGIVDSEQRETSLKQVVNRVVDTITEWGLEQEYFDDENSKIFNLDLKYLILNQYYSFNSPVWFNVGIEENPQVSACFIQGVDDSMESIMELTRNEAFIFKGGSGSGTNFSKLRGKEENLSTGGKASGPVSFMKALDSFAGVIKSGGKCLAPWQKIFTEYGPVEVMKLSHLNKFIVLSYDPPSNRIKAKWAKAWKEEEKDLVRIYTDKGKFDLSYDHPVKLSTGEYVEAIKLNNGMSLFSGSVNEFNGYYRVNLRDGKKGKELFHRMIVKDILNENLDNIIIHHIDEDKKNNIISNLNIINQSKHAKIHMNKLVEKNEHIFQNQSFPQYGKDNPMHKESKFWKDKKKVNKYIEKQQKILVESGRAIDMQKLAAKQKMLNLAYKLINNGHEFSNFETYIKARKTFFGYLPSSENKIFDAINRNFRTFENFIKELDKNNHRVIKIEKIGKRITYNVEVMCDTNDDKSVNSGHNFLIVDDLSTKGIFVSNTRRAAKIAILDCDHLDIVDFIKSKTVEEKKAMALVKEGYSVNFEDEHGAYQTVAFQNQNNSVNIFDEFIQAVEENGDWLLKPRGNGKSNKVNAKELFLDICKSAHACGDPGLIFDGIINRYHTCPNSGKIRGLNPCAEYIDIDDSACNLGSINLKRFVSKTENGFVFDIEGFKSAVWLATLAQEIMVDKASYPTEKIGNNARRHRQLGVGYCNLGALLMYCGLAYDSDEGRALAASISSLLTATVYEMSGFIARIKEPFEVFKDNKSSVRSVLQKHRYNIENKVLSNTQDTNDIKEAAIETWDTVLDFIEYHGIRNSKATVLAPTGTIGFMMDCDTTGVEPELFLVKYKTLVGGGSIKIINNTIGQALVNLGYPEKTITKIIDYIEVNGTVEGCKLILKKHLSIFDTSYSSIPGGRCIEYTGHIKMLGAIQPHISGGISKTVNMPNSATVEDVYNAFMMAYKSGCKVITIFRDGSKGSQPLNARKEEHKDKAEEEEETKIIKRSMPHECEAFRHGFSISGHKIYLHTGFFPDGTLGEIFVRAAKEGSTMSGFLESIAILTSVSLQYGVPLKALVSKLEHISFEPNGYTGNKDIGYAKSIVDYIFRYLGRYVQREEQKQKEEKETIEVNTVDKNTFVSGDGPPCSNCGSIMVRRGACYYCDDCHESTGCS